MKGDRQHQPSSESSGGSVTISWRSFQARFPAWLVPCLAQLLTVGIFLYVWLLFQTQGGAK